MLIETVKSQVKLAEILHKQDRCGHASDDKTLTGCTRAWDYMGRAGTLLALLIPTLTAELLPQARADERDKVAYHIKAELVCCEIFDQMEAEAAKGTWDERSHQWVMPKSWEKLRGSHLYHPMCFYGAWAAALAKAGPEFDGRDSQSRWDEMFKPCPPPAKGACVPQGGQEPCQPNYWCPTQGEYESPCHGGFDTCCSGPELHRETK